MARAGYAEWDEEDAFDERAERPVRRAARRRLPWLRLILLSSGIVGGLAYLAHDTPRAPAPSSGLGVAPSSLTAPAPVWRPVPASPPPAEEPPSR